MVHHRCVRFVAAGLLCSLLFQPIATAAPVISPNYDQPVPDFKLIDTNGTSHTLSQYADKKATVIAFLGLGCPLSNLYMPRYQSIADRFAGKSVTFLAINSNAQDTIEDIKEVLKEFDLRVPMLKDTGNKVADSFGAYRTNEIYVLDARRRIQYHGKIDDQYGIGYQRARADHTYLIDAVDSVLAGKPVAEPRTVAIGCVIGRELTPSDQATVTYHNQIERIFQQNCMSCHRQGQIAPFELAGYDDAKGWAGMIREVVSQRRMPPWHANPKFSHFINDRSLSETEIEMILKWVDDGAPQGNTADAPAPIKFAESQWVMGEPDAIIELPEPFEVPADGVIDYQYFRVDTNFDEDKWVVAGEIRPGVSEVVHHVLTFVRPAEDADALEKRRDARRRAIKKRKDETARRNEKGQRNEQGQARGGRTAGILPARAGRLVKRGRDRQRDFFFIGNVPGQMPFIAPPNSGKLLPKGATIVFQMHYTPNGRKCKDRTKMGLIFAKKPPKHIMRTAAVGNFRFRIPPNAANHQIGAKFPVRTDIKIVSFMPHMHLRGKAFRYEVIFPDGREQVLLDVPRYDFGWQIRYVLEKPILLPKGSEIFCRGTYDNSANNPANPDPNAEVRYGDQTFDEMMFGFFDYIELEPLHVRGRTLQDAGSVGQ